MPSLPTTVSIAELPFHLPSGLPVWGNDLELDLVILPDRLYIGLKRHFDTMNAKLIARCRAVSSASGPRAVAHALAAQAQADDGSELAHDACAHRMRIAHAATATKQKEAPTDTRRPGPKLAAPGVGSATR